MRLAGSVLGKRSTISREVIADTAAIAGLKNNTASVEAAARAGRTARRSATSPAHQQ